MRYRLIIWDFDGTLAGLKPVSHHIDVEPPGMLRLVSSARPKRAILTRAKSCFSSEKPGQVR